MWARVPRLPCRHPCTGQELGSGCSQELVAAQGCLVRGESPEHTVVKPFVGRAQKHPGVHGIQPCGQRLSVKTIRAEGTSQLTICLKPRDAVRGNPTLGPPFRHKGADHSGFTV